MSHALHDLLNLLKPKKLEDGLFRGQSEDLGLRHVFGGQVLGQALYAARDTIPADRMIHSLHSYFLRPGDIEKAIIYSVETLRDGQSFSARRISALQDDQPIFTMTASFQAAENGFEHQKAMPQVRGPENLPAESEIARQLSQFIPEKSKGILLSEKPFEIRPVTFHNPLKGHVDDPLRHVWLRLNGTLSEETGTGQSLLAYASDYNFLPVALQPHGKGFLEPGIQIATVDHSIWFHRPFDLNQWLLYSMESTSASGARGFVRGEFYSQDGTLVASTAQEGVIRVRP